MKILALLITLVLSAPSFADYYDSVEFEEHIEDVYEDTCGTDSDCVAEMVDRESY